MKSMLDKKKWMVRGLAVLALVFIVSGCGQKDEAKEDTGKEEKTVAATTEAEKVEADKTEVEADATEVSDAEETIVENIFDSNWDNFMSKWKSDLTEMKHADLTVISNEQEKESAYGLLTSASINESQLVALSGNTDTETEKLITVVVSGIADDTKDVYTASTALIQVADSTLSSDKIKEMETSLGLDGSIIDKGQLTIEENGLIYTTMVQELDDLGPMVSLTIQKGA